MKSSNFEGLFDAVTGKVTKNKASQTLLALDLGACTGWAMWKDSEVSSGSINLKKKNSRRFEGPGMKFIRFSRWLKTIPAPDILAFEAIRRHLGVDAAHAYGGYLALLTAFCEASEPTIPYEGFAVGTIKKRATGNGAASKVMMIDACCEKLGIIPSDDNEADAAWILLMMVEEEGLEWPGGRVAPPPEKNKKNKKKRK
jgi:hypothetical protein